MAKKGLRGLGERIISALGGITKSEKSEIARRAYEAGYGDGNDDPQSGDIAPGGFGYRRATTGGLRDFTRIDHDRILGIVWTLYQSNPIAKRALKIITSYILGDGVKLQIEDDDLTAIIEDFWRINQLDLRLEKFILQLSLWGEQIFPVFVRRSDGRVRLGYVDPADVDNIIAHPENSMEHWAVVVRPYTSATENWRVYRVIREDDDVVMSVGVELDGDDSPVSFEQVQKARNPGKLVTADQANLETWEKEMLAKHGLETYSGSCFLFQVNNVSNQPRGFSDLLQEADWMDQHDETLFALADREQMAGYFSWDVTVEGADEARVKSRAAELRANPPKRGSVNVHNEKESWNFNYPDLKQAPTIATADALLKFILGGLGLPKHWYGSGDETNRATAQAQGDPTWKTLKRRQAYVRHMILFMLRFARDQAEIAGAWRPRMNDSGRAMDKIVAVMPEMTVKDISAITGAMISMTSSLMIAVEQGLMSYAHAVETWAKLMAELNIHIDPEAEIVAIEEERRKDDLTVTANRNSWFAKHGSLADDGDDAIAASVPPAKTT